MEFDDHRRMYSINIGDHTHPLGFGNHGGTPIHLHQSQTIQTEHPRLLVGSMIDGAVVTISPQIGPHSLQQPIHHAILPHQPHLPQQSHHQPSLNEQPMSEHHHIQQPQTHSTNAQQHMVRVAVGRDLTTEAELTENALINAENMEMISQCERVVETAATDTITSRSRWCLVCNESLPDKDSPEVVNIGSTTMSTTHRKLSTLLKRLTTLSTKKAHSSIMCQQCFSLVDQLDVLEIKLADTKMAILKQYKSTLTVRQPSIKLVIDKATEDDNDDLALESSDDSSVEDDPTDPDVTPSTLRNTSRKAKKLKRKSSKRENKQGLNAKLTSQKKSYELGRKRGRGRPRKKDKEEEDFLPPGELTKECPCCQKVVLAKKYLSHLSIHRMFPCPFCLRVFKRKDIKTHIAEAHQEEVHYPCTECDQIYDTFMQLRKHCLVIHMGVEIERAQCSLCIKSFSSPNALKVHMETIHFKAQVYECQLCKESFNQRGNMRNHYRRIHQGIEARRLQCSLCRKGFICPSDLRKHVERVHLKIRKNEVLCKVCSKSFSDSRALKIHMNAIHTKEVQYPCPDCKMVFHSLTNMVTHRRRMHSGNEARKHVCSVCSKGFCSPSDLRTHVKVVHENVRKFICDICGQSFKVGSHLKYHRRKHTGETPYNCPHCDKSFHGPSHISDHIKKVHKTVYMGVNQRRRLNLPEDAPPPPPGILSSRNKTKHTAVVEEIQPAPTQVIIQPPQNQQASATISTMQHIHHNMMPFTSQPNHMIQTSMMDPHTITHNPYTTNIQFEQTNTQSPVPMVVRLLHDMQY